MSVVCLCGRRSVLKGEGVAFLPHNEFISLEDSLCMKNVKRNTNATDVQTCRVDALLKTVFILSDFK